ncbi:tyrosine-type recombinase/integrase, partial [Escherichia coli]
MTKLGVAETIEKLGKACGVHAHPHRFRRTCAIRMIRAGADLFSVQQLLGHADLEVMRRYAAINKDDVMRAHERFGPI